MTDIAQPSSVAARLDLSDHVRVVPVLLARAQLPLPPRRGLAVGLFGCASLARLPPLLFGGNLVLRVLGRAVFCFRIHRGELRVIQADELAVLATA